MDKHTIDQVLKTVATEQEAKDVAEFLGSAEGQLLVSGMIDADMETMVPHFDVDTCERTRINSKVKHLWWRVAAVVAMLLTLGVGAMWMMPKMHQPEVVMQTICANRGEQIQVVLQDGTHIFLNSGSRLVFPSKFTAKNRHVNLTGEAYFKVVKDQHRPFTVDLNGVSVEVLGTQFNVSAYENEPLQVNLDEGHVLFHGAKQTVDMQTGERLEYDRLTCQSTIYRNANTQMASAWKEHRLEVSEMPMQQLINLLERRYDVHIDVRDRKCYDFCYSLAVNDGNIRTVLKRMTYVSPIRYHYDDEAQYVSIRLAK